MYGTIISPMKLFWCHSQKIMPKWRKHETNWVYQFVFLSERVKKPQKSKIKNFPYRVLVLSIIATTNPLICNLTSPLAYLLNLYKNLKNRIALLPILMPTWQNIYLQNHFTTCPQVCFCKCPDLAFLKGHILKEDILALIKLSFEKP